jgi:hypothetical protein
MITLEVDELILHSRRFLLDHRSAQGGGRKRASRFEETSAEAHERQGQAADRASEQF